MPEVQNPPEVTILEVTRSRISDKVDRDISIATFIVDQNILQWEARADGFGKGQGDLVGSGGSATVGTEIQFEVENEELTRGDKTYRINIYCQNTSGVWTPYYGEIPLFYLYDRNLKKITDINGEDIVVSSSDYISIFSGDEIDAFISNVL